MFLEINIKNRYALKIVFLNLPASFKDSSTKIGLGMKQIPSESCSIGILKTFMAVWQSYANGLDATS